MPFPRWLFLALFAWVSPLLGADPAEITVTSDLPYKSGPELTPYETARCKLDLFRPAGAANLPCLVWFHGGGLTGGSKGDAKNKVTRALAGEGMLVASVNYRLSPQAKYPAYLEDAAASVAWVIQHAAEYGGDPHRVFIAGHSAGGWLTAMLGADSRWLQKYGVDSRTLAGLIPLSGQMMTHYTIREERGLPKTTIIADEAAPIYHAGKDSAPWLILYAEHDMTLRADENRYFAAALRAAGHEHVDLREIPAHDHSGMGNHIPDAGDPVREAIAAFVRGAGALP